MYVAFFLQVRADTFLIVIATLLSGGVIGDFILRYLNKRAKKKRIRLAFKSELNEMRDTKVNIDGKPFTPLNYPDTLFPTTVYDTHAGELGLLSEEEVTKIVKFYSGLSVLRKVPQESVRDEERGTLNEFVHELRRQRNDAIREIDENI